MTQETQESEGFDSECAIVLIGIGKTQFFLYRGDEYINQLLLKDGDFPTPVRCLNYNSIIDVRLGLGEVVNVSQYWGIHPDIVARLRDADDLIETDE